MGRKRIGQVDLRTGEVLDGFVAYVAPRRINGFGERWLAMAQSAALIFAKSDLGLGELRVLFMLLAKLDFENLLVLNQSEIARELGMQRQNVQRAIKRLMEMGALLEGPKAGQSRSYQLNPSFGWKGSARNHVQALDEYRNNRQKKPGNMKLLKGGKADEPELPEEKAPRKKSGKKEKPAK